MACGFCYWGSEFCTFNLPNGPVNFYEEGIVKSILPIKKFLRLVEMTFGLVNASFSLPKRQGEKLTFFAPCFIFNSSQKKKLTLASANLSSADIFLF